MGRSVLARQVDVADREQMREFAAAAHAQAGPVDLLVNNAGVGLAAGFLDTELEDWDWILGINVLGVVHGCHFFLPPMVRRGTGGHVANVSSMAGFHASPVLNAYTTTKFGVLGFSEALREELRPHRIGVTAICPGMINTPITVTSPRARRGSTTRSCASGRHRSTPGATTGPTGWRATSWPRCSATARSRRSPPRPGWRTRSSAHRPGWRGGWPGAWRRARRRDSAGQPDGRRALSAAA